MMFYLTERVQNTKHEKDIKENPFLRKLERKRNSYGSYAQQEQSKVTLKSSFLLESETVSFSSRFYFIKYLAKVCSPNLIPNFKTFYNLEISVLHLYLT